MQRILFIGLILFFVATAQAQNYTSTFLSSNNLHMDKADIDLDGDLDIITGGLYCLSWEENKGNNVFVNHVISQTQPEVQWVVGANLDDDAYMDIVTASLSNSAVYWVRNTGNQNFAQTTIATGTGGVTSISVADLDNDGDKDVVGAGFTGDRIFWLQNNGSEVFTQIELTTNFDGAINVQTGDMDGDGDIDILAAAREGGKIIWFRNQGSGNFTQSNITTSLTMPREVKLRDYDQDGDLDVLFAADGGYGWYRNNNALFTQVPYFSGSGIYSVDVADIDGDGLLDFLTANPGNGSISWGRNTGNQILGPGGSLDNVISSPSLIVPGNFNSDSRVDVMCGSDFDIRLAVNNPGQVITNIAINKYASNNHGACHGDFDNDGDVDLMETAFTFMYWYRNEGNGEFTPIRLSDNNLSWINNNYGVNIETVDMDLDGDDDAVFNEKDNGRVSWIENRGGGLFSYRFAFSVSTPYSIDPVDFDFDGDIDVVCGSTGDDAVYWFENDGDLTFTEHLILGQYWDPFAVKAADIDEDGDMDVFSAQGNPSNKLIFMQNSGNNLDFDHYETDATAINISSIDIRDVDGDGDLDLLSATGGTEDKISWYRNSGGAFPTFTELTVSTGVDGATFVYSGDYDGDGDIDVVSAEQTDRSISLYKNNGSQSFTRLVLASQIDGADFVGSGDLDGDGLEEIYATGSTHGIVQVFKNTPFTPPPPVTLTPCSDLFISEYVEGSSWNKAIEIYNPTANPIDLAPYRVQIYANGSTQPTQTLAPNGTVAAGDVYGFVHILADLDFWFEGDIDGQYNFNGNDAITLTKNGDIIDIIGVIGTDPGTGWEGTGGVTTVDRTLVRKSSITKGNNVNGPTFDASIEWDVYPIDAYQYFGNHTCVCANACVPTIAITASANDICTGTSVTFTASITNGGDTPVYQWKKNGNNVGTNSATYTAANLVDNDIITCTLTSNASCALSGSFASNSVVMNVLPAVTPTITISTPSTTICNGASATFTASITNGGAAPVYQWKKNGSNVGTNSSTYVASGLVSGDVITCVLTSNASCASVSSATSTGITITVVSSLSPSVSITGTSTTICAGTSVTFTATPVNGGNTPAYQWKVNGNNVGTNSSTYTTTTLTNGNVVTCVLTSNASCLSTTTATSNSITITVNPNITPTISITTPNTTICASSSVTFTASVTNAGTAPVYQWKKNGSNVGTNSSTYSASSWTSGDVITCQLTGSATCGTSTVTSNSITLTVTAPVTPSISIFSSGSTICSGDLVIFNSNTTNGGTSPSWVWRLNGNIVETNGNAWSSTTLQNGDQVNVTVTSSLGCVTQTTATSNTITLTVNPSVSPTIAITASSSNVCAGTLVSFTASITNGGSSPVYQWKRNGNNVGTNSASYSSSALQNGDVITCQLTGSLPCGTTPITSNSVTMSVSSSATPTITINTNNTSICSGIPVSFTATTTNGGSNPTLNWRINGNVVYTGPSPFTSSSIQNGDVVSCNLVSNAPCVANPSVNSNSITLTVSPSVTPSVVIATPATTICAGQLVTFTATPTNGGTPGYQWKKNGSNVGSNTASYTASNFVNGDVVTCVMSSTVSCATSANVTSNSVTLTVIPGGDPVVNISTPITTVCAGDEVVFSSSVSSGGSNPSFTWLINGNPGGGNGSSFVTSSLVNGDVISLTVTGAEGCVGSGTSSGISMTVNTVNTPSISENSGQLVATEIPGASYTWYLEDEILAGETGFSLTPLASGSYSVEASLNGCTSDRSATYTMIVTFLNENARKIWQISPNPASFEIRIQTSEIVHSIRIFDASGRLIGEGDQQVIDVSQLANGMYFVQVNKLGVQKFMVQH